MSPVWVNPGEQGRVIVAGALAERAWTEQVSSGDPMCGVIFGEEQAGVVTLI